VPNEIITPLMGMGFSRNACMRAAIETQIVGIEAATNWLLTHVEDASMAS